MTQKQARKVALRYWAARAKSGIDWTSIADSDPMKNLPEHDRVRVDRASKKIGAGLQWNADGRPEET
jgi:hypothetical protein